MFLFVTDKNGTNYALNKNMISRIVETRDSLMIVMNDGITIYVKEKFLEFTSRLNLTISC
jgi:uncharacterized protein YlzI (FlbEa/FlbD family)